MLCFTRDTKVFSVFNNSTDDHSVFTPAEDKPSMQVTYNGVIPFYGFTMYGKNNNKKSLVNKKKKKMSINIL